MKHLLPFTSKDRDTLIKHRKGESKFGEHIKLISNYTNIYESLVNLDVDYVIFGISEDIGVYANYGKTGTYKAWNATIKSLLNIQHNALNKAKRTLVLGYLDFSNYKMFKPKDINKPSVLKARQFVETVDKEVTFLVSLIVKAGKIPIIIGGGHNNAYGNIKGLSLAKNEKVNAINFDAHTDFRPEEGRHSGNGFSYAFAEGFLKNYYVFGLHENYTSDKLFKTLKKIKSIKYTSYEALEVRQEVAFDTAMNNASEFITNRYFGLEIDCDAIENIPSSAKTPSGFSILQTRQFVNHFSKLDKVSYLHICEAAPSKKTAAHVGKLISYLITDFIKANKR